jgi:DNA-binding CsgD family transcriptional regulator
MRTNYAFSAKNGPCLAWVPEDFGFRVANSTETAAGSVALLIEAIDQEVIAAIRRLLPPEARLRLVVGGDVLECTDPAPSTKLSSRQRDILALLVEGHSNKAIGRCLGISHFTVRNHLSQIMRDLKIADRRLLAKRCLAGGVNGFSNAEDVASETVDRHSARNIQEKQLAP